MGHGTLLYTVIDFLLGRRLEEAEFIGNYLIYPPAEFRIDSFDFWFLKATGMKLSMGFDKKGLLVSNDASPEDSRY